jgi:succinylglutamic semialdehyde dehydrogenase
MPQNLESTNPSTGELVWSGTLGDAATEVALARAAFPSWAARPLDDRVAVLRRFAAVVREREQAFAETIARETGKPLWEAKTEVTAVINKVEISIEAHAERTGLVTLDADPGNRVGVRHKPHGVLAVLGPYNFPAHLPNGHIVPALLAGNCVVFKPSEKTPASGAFLVDCFHEAGVPAECVRLLVGEIDEGKALAADPGIDGLLFTGSVRGGQAIHRQFADRPQKILALELGGNNPIVVWRADNVEAAAAIIVQSAYLSAGQRCTAARRLIVEAGQEQPLLDAIARLTDRIIVGDAFADPQPFMGPVIDTGAADLVQGQWDALVKLGGTVLRPLERPDPAKPFLTPAFIDMTGIDGRPDEEIFGPVLQLFRVDSFDAAIAAANDTGFGLAASLIGGTQQQYDRYWAEVRAGVINWNRPTNGAPSNAPFGGVGLSGNHRPSAYYAADYCAYPVTSVAADKPRAAIAQGLMDVENERA